MRVLLTGCRGQLGIEVGKQLSCTAKNYEIMETDVYNLDITNQNQVISLIESTRPDIVINCAAYTDVDACETDELNAFRVNAIGAQNLSVGACKAGARIVQISTDYVFDGTGNIPKKEYDSINPQSIYGKSKALGEKLVRETNPRHFIIRTAWLYGEGNNFVRTMLKLAREQPVLNIVGDQYGSPTSTVDLAKCIVKLMDTENYGTYHATCEGFCSWYRFAQKIFQLKGIGVNVNTITTEELGRPAKRPRYSVLDNYMLKLLELNTFRHWEEALEDYLKGGNPA